MKTFLSIIFIFIIAATVYCQPLNALKYETMISTGDECFENKDYDNALDYYSKALEEKKDPLTSLKMAETYYMMRDYKQATRTLKGVLTKDKSGVYNDYRLLYAKSLKRMGQYQEAYNEFKDYYQKTDDPDGRSEAMLEIKGLELFNSLDENVEMEFKPLGTGINKGFSIYGLQKRSSNDSIYFGSFNTSKKIVLDGKSNEVKKDDNNKKDTKKDKDGDGSRGQIMMSKRDSKGDYISPTAMDNRFNRVEYHSIYPAFSADGNRLFYTRKAMEGTIVLESRILYSEFKGGEWTAPMELPVINGDFQSKMPSFGELLGKEALFFVSDMPGGQGGFDIYYSLINDDGSLELPVNLGKNVNTVDDEITPYFTDGKLYFSSNGYPSLGGFDIFVTRWNGLEWSLPENLGKGFNSSTDDIGLTISSDGRSGFLLSNRPYEGKKKLASETCCDHAFRVSARDLVIQLIVEVFDEKGELNNAVVQLADVSKVKPLAPESKSNFSGNTFNFLLDPDRSYQAIVTREGYDPVKIPFNTAGIFDDFTITKKAVLVKAAPEYEIIKINQPIRLNNIYYDYDDYKILPDAEADLEKLLDLMNQYPEMVIELSSHTDSRATDKYNIKLSQNRAESAKKWLTQNGVEVKRIVAVGYGETRILNKCKDNVDCTEDEHRLNRRTEFKILKGPQEITIEKQVFKSDKKIIDNQKK